MSLKSIIEILKLIPQLWAIYLQVVKTIEKQKLAKKKQELSENTEKIQEAKTSEDIKNAFRDRFK